MIKIKLYDVWHEYNTKREAINNLLELMEHSEGAELGRYTRAFFQVRNGRKIVDIDEVDEA